MINHEDYALHHTNSDTRLITSVSSSQAFRFRRGIKSVRDSEQLNMLLASRLLGAMDDES